MKFDRKVLFIGFGAVARCTLPMLVEALQLPLSHITVLDVAINDSIIDWVQKGVKFHKVRITRENIEEVMSKYTHSGDLVIDLSVAIDTKELLYICNRQKLLYINAATEEWEPFHKKDVYQETLYYRHMRMREFIASFPKGGPTAVVEHGANPGLISHFVRQGLQDIAEKILTDGKCDTSMEEDITSALKSDNFAELAMKLGVKVIHVSERDTQVTNIPKRVDEFVNTWSVDGLYEEGIAPTEIGWGTHEKVTPSNALMPPEGPMNQIFLRQPGIDTWVRTFVPPNHEVIGMVIRHGEAFTISEKLTLWKDGKPVYRPTVHYAYCPCDSAVASIHELRGRNYRLQPVKRILRDKDIVSGADTLGALFMGHEYNSWWTGTHLSVEEARRLVPGQNATTIQVAAGLVAAIFWMLENPNKGLCVPDDLPYDFILDIAKPFLGKFISEPYDWTPIAHRRDLFPEMVGQSTSDPWQFQSFWYHLGPHNKPSTEPSQTRQKSTSIWSRL